MSRFNFPHKKNHPPKGSSVLEKPRRSHGNPRKLRFESLEDRQLLSVTIYSTNLETNPGWTTSGEWAFGHPTGQGGGGLSKPDPSDGYSGRNVYGVNLNGNYDQTIRGSFYLTTNAINCTGYKDVSLTFGRWLNMAALEYGEATIDVSSDAVNWHNIYSNLTTIITEYSWSPQQFDLSAYADKQATVYLRWGYHVFSGAYAYSGWNIDDIKLTGTQISPSQTKIWDGGSQQNSFWSTPENWVGDVAPQAGDDLVFPTSQIPANRWESTNNFPAQVHFHSITVSDSRYLLHGGVLSFSSLQVSAGTLNAGSIVADALTIGAAPQKASIISAAKVVNEPFERAKPFTALPQTAAVDALKSAAATETAFAAQSTIAPEKETIPEKISAAPAVKQAFSLPAETSPRGIDLLIAETMPSKPFGQVVDAALYGVTKFDDPFHLSSNPSLRIVRLNDFVAEKPVDIAVETKKPASSGIIPSPDAHRLAFTSLRGEPEEFEILDNKQSQKRDKLSAKVVDDIHLNLAIAIY